MLLLLNGIQSICLHHVELVKVPYFTFCILYWYFAFFICFMSTWYFLGFEVDKKCGYNKRNGDFCSLPFYTFLEQGISFVLKFLKWIKMWM